MLNVQNAEAVLVVPGKKSHGRNKGVSNDTREVRMFLMVSNESLV